jgi:hypothetical protein
MRHNFVHHFCGDGYFYYLWNQLVGLWLLSSDRSQNSKEVVSISFAERLFSPQVAAFFIFNSKEVIVPFRVAITSLFLFSFKDAAQC